MTPAAVKTVPFAVGVEAAPVPRPDPALALAAVRAEITAGLLAPQASVSPKFLYDELGSTLFEAICALPEYYPTRTEAAIIARHGADIARAVGLDCAMIDLGAGNCAKAAGLFPLLHPSQYVAIDISHDFLHEALGQLRQRFPHIEMTALGMDFSETLTLPAVVRPDRRLFFYPGSSIGNFTPEQAVRLLRRMRACCDDAGGLLIGIDLVKDSATLDAAYDDALGVTAAFNLNLLRHLNRLARTDFDVRQWRHVAFYHAAERRVEMHLEARDALTVTWPGAQRAFAAGERIHTENSYKYTVPLFAGLLEQAGFALSSVWTDADQWFALIHARAVAP